VMLRRKAEESEKGLRVDRLLLEALLEAEQGLPSTFRRSEPEARISAFYDRLARRAWEAARQDVVRVRLVDIDTGKNLQLTVDVQHRQYHRH
jgi:hypothetical protein